jgi:hypothetical protein
MFAVYNSAKKFDQQDIVKVALYRGKKMVLLKKIGDDTAAKAAEVEKKAKEAEPPKLEGF